MNPGPSRILSIILLLLLVASYIPPIAAATHIQYTGSGGFTAKQLAYPIAVIGDYPRSADGEGDIYTLLIDNGFSSSDIMQYDDASTFMADLGNGQLYSLVILNRWSTSGDATAEELLDFVRALDLRDIPLLILDASYTSYTGGDQFYAYRDNLTAAGYPAPLGTGYGYPSPSYVLVDPVNTSHPAFAGVADPYYLANTSTSSYADYLFYTGFNLEVTLLAWINDTSSSSEGYGIVEWQAPGGESWIFSGSGGSSYWMRYTEVASDGQYSSDHAKVFINIVNYLISTGNPHQPPKGVVYGYVVDAVTGEPVVNATVSAGAVSNTTNATGGYELYLDPGTYTVTVSKPPVYIDYSFTVTITGGDTHEVNVTLHRKPVIRGTVTDADTGEPIAGARVYTNTSVENYTDSSGQYVLHLDPGSYEIYVEDISHRTVVFTVTVAADNEYTYDVSMEKKPKADVFVAIIGDYADYDGYGTDLYNFLKENYSAVYYPSFDDFVAHKTDYEWDVVILHWLGSSYSTPSAPDITTFIDTLRYLDSMNIPVIILDTWYYGYPAGYYMYTYRDDISAAGYPAPASRSESYGDTGLIDVVVVNATHPVFNGVPSTYNVTDYSTTYYAYYSSFTTDVVILANLSNNGSNLGISIAEWKASGNESWIFISYGTNIKHHYNVSDSYGFFTPEAKKVLVNAIDYANTTHVPPPIITIYGHVYDEAMNPVSGAMVWIEGVSGAYNYTDSSGYYMIKGVFGLATYTMKAAKLGYYMDVETVTVGTTDYEKDFVLVTKPPVIVVVGDHDTGSGKDLNLTLSNWWTIQEAADYKELWDIINYEGQVEAVIFNSWTGDYTIPPAEDIVATLQLLDNHSIPALFLAGYGGAYYGVYPIYYRSSDVEAAGYPAPDNYDYWYYADADKLWMNMTDPGLVFFKNIAPDTDDAFHIHSDTGGYGPYRGFNFTDDAVRVAAWFTDLDHGQVWGGVVTWNTTDGTRWVFMIGASTDYVRYSEPGDVNQYNYKMKLLLNNTINYLLNLTPPTLVGTLEGTVTDEYSNPLAGATVEIVELGLINYTDDAGHYMLKNVPSGTYTLKVTYKGYYPYTATISVGSGVNVYDVALVKASHIVAVIGDNDADIANYLWDNQSIYAIHYDDWNEFVADLCSGDYNFTVVVIDQWGSGLTAEDIVIALKLLDAYNLPVVFLDTYAYYTLTGVNALYQYRDEVRAAGYPAPIMRDSTYPSYLYITMNASTHPVFNGITPDFDNAFYVEDDPTTATDGAYWYFDPADNVTVLGYLGSEYGGIKNATVAEWTAPGGEAWVFLGAAGTYWLKYSTAGTDGRYSGKAWMLLVNAIVYANTTRGAPTPSVVYHLTIKDIITDSPIENAEIYVNETGDTFYSAADGTVTVTLPLRCGNYTLIISRSGYFAKTISLYGFINYTDTIYLAEYGNGTITGYVYDADTHDPIANALVYIPGVNSTYTAADGSFSLKVPSGSYILYARAPGYAESNASVVVPANTTVSVTFYLESLPPTILVVGDYYDDISQLLTSLGYNVETVDNWSVAMDKLPWGNYILVIINTWGPSAPSAENVTAMLTLLDSMDMPVIFLDSDSYGVRYFGAQMLYNYRDEVTALGYVAPATRSEDYGSSSSVYIQMLSPEHPLFTNITPDTDNMFLVGATVGSYADYAYYTFTPTLGLMLLGNLVDTGQGVNATAVAVWVAPGGERWIFLGASASFYWMEYNEVGGDDQYSSNAAQLLANAVEYALTYRTVPSISLTVQVYDVVDEIPLENVNVTVQELGVSQLTGADGTTVFTVLPGTLNIYVSKPGYFNKTITLALLDTVTAYTLTVYLAPYGNATVTGYVVDAETGAPVSGVNVSIPGVNWTLTGPDGSYSLKVPAGAYTVIHIAHLAYIEEDIPVDLRLHPGDVAVVNITARPKPPIVVILAGHRVADWGGGYADEDLKAFVESLGYYTELYDNIASVEALINAGAEVSVVILNDLPLAPGASSFVAFIQLLDENNVSLLILDTWGSSSYYGGYLMYLYNDDLRSAGYVAPATRYYAYEPSPAPGDMVLEITDATLYGFTYDIGFKRADFTVPGANEFDYAYYTFEPGDLFDIPAYINDTYHGYYKPAAYVWYPEGGERWIFLPFAADYWNGYTTGDAMFSDQAKLFVARAINYAMMRGMRIVIENFTIVSPHGDTILAGDEFRISGYAYYMVGNTKAPLANKTLLVYLLSTPYTIGNVTTGPDGSFDETLTMPEDAPSGTHALGIGGNNYTIYVLPPSGSAAGPEPGLYMIAPAPEPGIMPIILLAAILFLVLAKKRR